MISLAGIACSHGLGHMRRMMAVIEHLLTTTDGLQVRLFGRKDAWIRLELSPMAQRLGSDSRFNFVDFDTSTDLVRLLKGKRSSVRWHERLPDLPDDLVWCDNLLEILEVRSDAIITGSFFWHEVVAHVDEGHDHPRRARELLDRHSPLVIGNRYFATPEVASSFRFVPVGLYRFHRPKVIPKTDLYLGAGSGGRLGDDLKQFLVELVASSVSPPSPFLRVWVEPDRLPVEAPDWLLPATYDAFMFGSVIAGCIRPGLGIISDLLLSQARLYAIKDGDFEMDHNAQTLERLGLGSIHDGYASAVASAQVFANDRLARRKHELSASELDGSGVEATCAELLSLIN